jgi:hypothetical protein
LDPDCSGSQDIDLGGFNFLDRTKIQLCDLGKLLLSHLPFDTFTAEVCAKASQDIFIFIGAGHVSKTRESRF